MRSFSAVFKALALLLVAHGSCLAESSFLDVPGQGFHLTLAERRQDALRRVSAADDAGLGEAILARVRTDGTGKFRVFSAERQKQIIVDVPGSSVAKDKTYVVEGNPTISTVRVGNIKGGTRIVFDLISARIPRYNWSNYQGELFLSIPLPKERNAQNKSLDALLFPEEEILAVTPRDPTPKATAAGDARASLRLAKLPKQQTTRATVAKVENKVKTKEAVTPAPKISVKSKEFNSQVIEVYSPRNSATDEIVVPAAVVPAAMERTLSIEAPVPAPLPTQEKPKAEVVHAKTTTLTGIAFDRRGNNNAPMVRLSLGEKSRFVFEKLRTNAYRLFVPNYSIDDKKLSLPYFPPQDFKGIASVSAQSKKDGIEIAIGIDRGTRLQAIPRGKEIWVQTGTVK